MSAKSGRGSVVLERILQVAAVVVGCLFAAGTAILGAFLSPFRIGGIQVPLSWGIVVCGAVVAAVVAGYGAGHAFAALLPALVWFAVMLPLSMRTAEGDVAISGDWVGYGVVLLGIPAFAGSGYALARLLGRSKRGRLSSPTPGTKR